MSDIRLPRLQIVYGVGDLAMVYVPGDLVLGKENLLCHKSEPLNMIVLATYTYWKEYGTPEMNAQGLRPRAFATEKEVLANGGTTQWGPPGSPKPTFSKAIDLKILIRKPKDLVCGLFGTLLADDGFEYAPAIWTADKKAYGRVGPTIISNKNFALRTRGLISGLFELRVNIETTGNNPPRVMPMPTFKLTGHNSDAVVGAIKALFDNRNLTAEDEEHAGTAPEGA